jgi:hypothetical protein
MSEGSYRALCNANPKEFTSIFKVADQLRAVAATLDVDSLQSLVEILITCLENVLRSLKHLPLQIRSAPDFGVAFRAVIFFGRMFADHIGVVTTRLSGIQLTKAVQLSLQSLDMTIASLKALFDLVEPSDTQTKPLPDIPIGSVPDATAIDGVIPGSSVENFPVLPIPLGSTLDTTAVDPVIRDSSVEKFPVPPIPLPDLTSAPTGLKQTTEDAPNTPMLPKFTPTKNSLRRLVSGLGRKTFKPLILWTGTISSESVSALAVTPHNGGSPNGRSPVMPSPLTSDQQATTDNVVPASPQLSRKVAQVFDVEPSLPSVELYFSPNKVLCAASLAALVRILTSTEEVRDPAFTDFFFCSFRFFSKPLEIFQMLAAQYDEGPPESLETAKAILWTQNVPFVKVRVAKVFLLWLRIHWRYEWDTDILEPLHRFASSRPADDPAYITWNKVTKKTSDASVGANYRGCRIQRAALTGPTLPKLTRLSRPFELFTEEVISQGAFDKVDILHFHSSTGREELARQLCLAASQLFRHIDPEDAVRYWKDGQDKAIGDRISRLASFENALSYWASNAIVARPTVRSRAEVMEFFVDLAYVSRS